MEKDTNQKNLFKDLVGENGELLVDTTKTDMDHVDIALFSAGSEWGWGWLGWLLVGGLGVGGGW